MKKGAKIDALFLRYTLLIWVAFDEYAILDFRVRTYLPFILYIVGVQGRRRHYLQFKFPVNMYQDF